MNEQEVNFCLTTRYRLFPDSPEQSSTGTATNEEHPPELSGLQSANQRTDEGTQEMKVVEEEEKNLTSTPEKAPFGLVPLQLSQLRTKNTDSFDMEEVRCSPAFSWGFLHWYLPMSGLFQHRVLHPVPTQGNWNVLWSHSVVSDAF